MLRSFLSHSTQRFYEPDKGNNPPATDPIEPNTSDDSVKTDDKKFTQAELDAIVTDRLARAKRKADDATEKAKSDAAQKALLEQGEFKTLAEQRASELATLTTELEAAKSHEETANKYKKALSDRLAVEKKAYPAHVVSLLDKLDPLDQLEWITVNADALKPITSDRQLGTPPRTAGKPALAPTLPNRANDADRSPFSL